MNNKVISVINSLDTRHTAAQSILRALAEGKKVKPADIDALDSKFAQVAPLLHKVNDGGVISQDDSAALDSFVGERLRTVLAGIGARKAAPTKQQRTPKRTKARKK